MKQILPTKKRDINLGDTVSTTDAYTKCVTKNSYTGTVTKITERFYENPTHRDNRHPTLKSDLLRKILPNIMRKDSENNNISCANDIITFTTKDGETKILDESWIEVCKEETQRNNAYR